MITALISLVSLSALAVLFFILGLAAINGSERWGGLMFGIFLISAGVAGFTATMIMFAIQYLSYFSTVSLGL